MFLSRSRILLLTLAAALASASAASVNIPGGTLTTTFDDPAGTAAVNESTFASFDLSDLSALLPGEPILLTFIYNEPLIWLGTISAGNDPATTANWAATFTLTVGAFSNSITETQSLGPGPFQGGGGGFAVLSGPNPLTLEVSWGSDLSNVMLTMTDHSSMSGLDAIFTNSRLSSTPGTLSTSSVPEPSTVLLALAALGLLRMRRRRA